MEQENADLVRRSRRGEKEAYEALFRRYQNAVYRVALYLVSDVQTAEDITQETFVRAWERLDALNDDRAFGGWVRTIAMNLVRDAHRHGRHTTELDEDADPSDTDAPSVDTRLAQSDRQRAVRMAVASLPEHQRLVVAMHHLEEMEVETIALTLNLPKGTVLSRLSRGRQMLRSKLQRYLGEWDGGR